MSRSHSVPLLPGTLCTGDAAYGTNDRTYLVLAPASWSPRWSSCLLVRDGSVQFIDSVNFGDSGPEALWEP